MIVFRMSVDPSVFVKEPLTGDARQSELAEFPNLLRWQRYPYRYRRPWSSCVLASLSDCSPRWLGRLERGLSRRALFPVSPERCMSCPNQSTSTQKESTTMDLFQSVTCKSKRTSHHHRRTFIPITLLVVCKCWAIHRFVRYFVLACGLYYNPRQHYFKMATISFRRDPENGNYWNLLHHAPFALALDRRSHSLGFPPVLSVTDDLIFGSVCDGLSSSIPALHSWPCK